MVEYLPKKVKDVDDFFGFCVKDMKISEADLLEDKVSPQVLGYTSWEQMYAMTDDVYSTTVRMIPCVYVSDCGR
jgi:thiaminase